MLAQTAEIEIEQTFIEKLDLVVDNGRSLSAAIFREDDYRVGSAS
jgi:hypothetical protein